jgi:hypothetical protein
MHRVISLRIRRLGIRDDAPDSASGLSRAKALEVLTELANMTAERDRLYAELIAAGLA